MRTLVTDRPPCRVAGCSPATGDTRYRRGRERTVPSPGVPRQEVLCGVARSPSRSSSSARPHSAAWPASDGDRRNDLFAKATSRSAGPQCSGTRSSGAGHTPRGGCPGQPEVLFAPTAESARIWPPGRHTHTSCNTMLPGAPSAVTSPFPHSPARLRTLSVLVMTHRGGRILPVAHRSAHSGNSRRGVEQVVKYNRNLPESTERARATARRDG